MTKALLTTAGLSWICLRDENGNYTGKREIALMIEFQSRRCNGKRCAFQQHYSETMVEHMKMSIDSFVKNSIYHFQKSIVAMCQRDNMEMMDIEECIYMLEHSLPQGFETFLNGDGLPWMQHYYTVIPVTRGTMYLGDDTAWHEAEEDMLLVVRDPWSETAKQKDMPTIMERLEAARIEHRKTRLDDNYPVMEFLEEIIYCPSQIEFYFRNGDAVYCLYIRQRHGDTTAQLVPCYGSGDFDFDASWSEIELSRDYDIEGESFKSDEAEELEIIAIEKECLARLRVMFPDVPFPQHPNRRRGRYGERLSDVTL